MKKNKERVAGVIWETVKEKKWLSLGIVLAVGGAVAASVFPPLILGRIIDALTAGEGIRFASAAAYFALIALAGVMEALREGGLTVFGQKITHALRSRLMAKFTRLSAESLNHQEHGGDALYKRYRQHVCRYVQDRQHSGGYLVCKPRADARAGGASAAAFLVHALRTEEYACGAAGEPPRSEPRLEPRAGNAA